MTAVAVGNRRSLSLSDNKTVRPWPLSYPTGHGSFLSILKNRIWKMDSNHRPKLWLPTSTPVEKFACLWHYDVTRGDASTDLAQFLTKRFKGCKVFCFWKSEDLKQWTLGHNCSLMTVCQLYFPPHRLFDNLNVWIDGGCKANTSSHLTCNFWHGDIWPFPQACLVNDSNQ